MNDEAKITINGVDLEEMQSATIRVALEGFASRLRESGLGDDEHGKVMTRLYLERIDEIRSVMFGPPGDWDEPPSTTFNA